MSRAKSNTESNIIKTELTRMISEFKEHLELRIKLGTEMLARTVNSDAEIESLIQDSNSWSDYNREYLKQSFNYPNNEYKRAYEKTTTYWGGFGSTYEPQPKQQQVVIKNQIRNLQDLVSKSELLKSSVPIIKHEKPSINKQEVFIVHGHDDLAKTSAARFVEKLGFKAIVLHEQPSSSRTIIEKIEQYSNVGFAIVLYTPCDVGGKTKSNLKLRARQNVVFEHGFLIGKIGRENVCALVKGDIETPNDISGVVYIKMDDDNAWYLKVARELKNSNYQVDMNKL